jgi:Rha family phage regulatory protein
VAEYFGKQHKNVLQSIQTLDCSEKFHRLNFQPMFRLYGVGNGATRQSKYYEMTRDGFMFTVMGFTGKRAARVKEAFTEAFNMMEERLRNPMMMLPDSEKIALLVKGIEMEKEKVEALTEQVTKMAPKASYD